MQEEVMSSLALRNISKIYPNNNCVVKNFNLEIQDLSLIHIESCIRDRWREKASLRSEAGFWISFR